MWKNRAVYIALLLGTGGMYIAANQRQLLILLLLLIGIPILTGLALIISAGRIHIDCKLQEACVIYQRIGVNLHVAYGGPLVIGRSRLKIEYENLLFGHTETQTIMLERGSKQEVYYEIPYISQDCGKIKMRFSRVVCYDIMGLFSRRCRKVSEQEFTVFPHISELQISLKHLPESVSSGEQYNQNRKGQDVTEVFDMREYQEGDSPRSIHWKLSSKLDNLIVREFSHPSNYYTLVLYDTALDTERADYHEVVNGVLGMTASVSRSLLNQNHVHHVGCISKMTFMDNEVEDNSTYMQMITNMMSTAISYQAENTMEEFMKQDIHTKFTKIVMVTGVFRELEVRRLANYVDLTVLLISKDEIEHMEQGPNYDVIALSVDALKDKVQMLDI